MTITTIAGALAGAMPPQYYQKTFATVGTDSGHLNSSWPLATGYPIGAGASDTTTYGGVTLNSSSSLVVGQIPFYNPVAGSNTYLLQFTTVIGTPGQFADLILADRLWHCGANTSNSQINTFNTSSQTITSVAWPPRDQNGTSNGYGVFVAIENFVAPAGGGPPTVNMQYTNANGVSITAAGNSLLDSTISSPNIGGFYPFSGWPAGSGSGDFLGVQSVQNITITTPYTTTKGTWLLVAYRQIAMVDVGVQGYSTSIDILSSGFPQLFNGSVPFLLTRGINATQQFSGKVQFTQG